jgi:hypothetical protein
MTVIEQKKKMCFFSLTLKQRIRMEQLCRILKPLANIYIILLSWLLTILNLYLYMKPLFEYATTAGLKTIPIVLDRMTYYTPDEGCQALSILGDKETACFSIG